MNSRNSISKRKHTGGTSSRHDEEMALELTLSSSPHTNRVDDDDNAINGGGKDDDLLSLSSASTRKRREELSILASSCIKKEMVEVIVTFE